ncbi:MAG: hypothetical protein JXR70_02205 [Spirochaetales bacterium]|nr:hypothetical protein [Spirochaetales bacterium]
MMHNALVFLFFMALLGWMLSPPVYGQISLEDFKVTIEDRIAYFKVYDFSIKGMKTKSITAALQLSQNDVPFEGSFVKLDPIKINYDPALWRGEAFWFYFDVDLLMEWGDPTQPYKASFLVFESAKNQLIFQKDISYSLPETLVADTFKMESPDEERFQNLNLDDYYLVSLNWQFLSRHWGSYFPIKKADFTRSVAERNTFQPSSGRAESEEGYITLCGIDFPEFFQELYGFLYVKNSQRLKAVKEEFLYLKEKHGLEDRPFAAFIISAIQNTEYAIPSEPYGIYTPLEVMETRKGDCDSRALLLYLLLHDLGYEVCLMYSDYYEHAMLGLAYVGGGDALKYGGVSYNFVETTSAGWEIGQLPPEFTNLNHWSILFPLEPD